jgi:hypothetical protein
LCYNHFNQPRKEGDNDMTITYTPAPTGNRAYVNDYIWTLDIESAKKLKDFIELTDSPKEGSYECTHYLCPIDEAIEEKQSTVTLYTSGTGAAFLALILKGIELDCVQLALPH